MSAMTMLAVSASLLLLLVSSSAQDTPSITVDFTILDGTANSEFVGDLKEKIPSSVMDASQIENLNFKFFGSSGDKDKFTVNGDTGVIHTNMLMDRETLPGCVVDKERACILNFKVVGTLNEAIKILFEVDVIIMDVNDNPPQFLNDNFNLEITENNQVGQSYSLEPADDKDSGNFSIKSYRIESITPSSGEASPSFSLSYDISTRNPEVKLIAQKSFDRENISSYQVKVVAIDGGQPDAKTGTLTINVQIVDLNDNDPQFEESQYNVTIDENTPVQTVILKVSAQDPDLLENGQISYRIIDTQLTNIFSINSTSGEIVVESDLVYQPVKKYDFSVEAKDHGTVTEKRSEVPVTINIRDTGNNPPKVTVSVGPAGYINMSESSALGAAVAAVAVSDPDSGRNGNVTCSVSDPHFSMQKLGNDFAVVVNDKLDRETKDLYTVTVNCHDQAPIPLSSSDHFVVRILDVNDNTPSFDYDSYTVHVPENKGAGVFVKKLVATDKDTLENKEIQYILDQATPAKFQVHPVTGNITTVGSLDRELQPQIVFRVLAVDQGKQKKNTGTTTVTVIVDDENDQIPKFSKTLHGFSVVEGLPAGTEIGQLSASDNDTGINAQFTFRIGADYRSVPFAVEPESGIITLREMLDYEEQKRYDFLVVVTDKGSPPQSSTAHVSVFIEDANDHNPRILFPDGENNNTVVVMYPAPLETVVTTILARDDDEGQNAELRFSIIGGNDHGIFDIDERTGEIFIAHIAEINSDILISLLISVRDLGESPRDASAKIYFDLRYTNESYPQEVKGDANKYIIISVVVILVTILVSAAIIGGIFVLRKLDRSKNKQENQSDADCGFSDPGSLTLSSTDGGSSGTDDPKKKKEVSFTLDSGVDSGDGRTIASLSDSSLKYNPPAYSRYQNSSPSPQPMKEMSLPSHNSKLALPDKVGAQLQKMKEEQLVLQARAKQWVHNQSQQYNAHPEDSHSHTSGETTTSDSGRGNSEEEDIHSSPSADDPKTFDIVNPVPQHCYSVSRQIPTVPNIPKRPLTMDLRNQYNKRSSLPAWSRKDPYSQSDLKTRFHNDRHAASQRYRDVALGRYFQNRQLHSGSNVSYPASYITPSSPIDFPGDSVIHSFFDSTRSQDGDDCSTTTSGSYTLYPEDIL